MPGVNVAVDEGTISTDIASWNVFCGDSRVRHVWVRRR